MPGGFCYSLFVATFRPPTDLFVSFDDGSEGIFKHLRKFPRGRNVYKMKDGSFTERDQYDLSLVEKIYHGGHVHELTAQEEADLIDAGYGDYIE